MIKATSEIPTKSRCTNMKIKLRVLGKTEISSMSCVMLGKLGDVYPCIENGFHPHTGGKDTGYIEMYSAVDWLFNNRVNRGCVAASNWLAQQLRCYYELNLALDEAIKLIFADIEPCERTKQVCTHLWDTIQSIKYDEALCNEYAEDVDYYLNENFLRVRAGGKLNSSAADEIYFRISSHSYDWRNVIEDFLWDTFSSIPQMPRLIWIGHDEETNPPEIVLFEGTPEEFFNNYDSKVLASTKLD